MGRSIRVVQAIRKLKVLLLATGMTMPQFGKAQSLYYEVEGGVSQVREASPFFGGGEAKTLAFGAAIDFGLFTGFTPKNKKNIFELQVGIQGHYVTATASGGAVSMLTPYPVVRLQAARLFLTAGASPLVYKTTPASSSFTPSTGSIAVLGELGLLWPITPEFSLGLVAGGEAVSTGGTLSPKPAAELTILMRFYFKLFGIGGDGNGSGRSSIEWNGWRYPFGEIQ